ncbi:proteasome assembly chaperone family protein [Haloglomus irregulare]|uniref:Proteasome assembly chaperone family protein n=1 Tax=Haloglomus irregulare TaxID=2234134 RepID=A0A554N967_9EURY|nr:PAC2 family protein [Haloglomus irregulare]TSD13957.1 proteasome assembly chaperone family protein [Haloglomus irregulare]
MPHLDVDTDFDPTDTTLVEGLPGAGLVGKIAADHLVETFDMTHVGGVYCDGIPDVAVYHGNDSALLPPVRLYGDAERELLVLQSDVPVSPEEADCFADCITEFIGNHDITPLYLSGLPEEKNGSPELYGIATTSADARLDEAGIVPPRVGGMVSGPTGALLATAREVDLPAIGLVAETDARFPDPESARTVITGGIEPLTGIDVDTGELVEHAEDIREAREQLAQRMEDAGEESTQARPLRGFQ